MKEFLVFLLFVIALWAILYVIKRKDKTEIKFLDKQHTDILKGYAILGVLVGHVGQYSGINGIEYPAGIGVSLFLILSGYGLHVSTDKNGLKGYWKKRILRVVVPYIIAQTVFYLVTAPNVSFFDIVLDYTLIMPRHEFGWYLRYILLCYIIYYFTFLLFKTNKQRIIVMLVCFSIWFIVRSIIWIDPTPFLQTRQMLAFPIGVLANIAKTGGWKKPWTWSISSIVGGTAVYGLLHTSIFSLEKMPLILFNLISMFTVVPCACGIIILVYLVRLMQNKGLILLASVSYEVYIVHGYFMRLITHNGTILSLLFFILAVSAGSLLLHFSLILITKMTKKLVNR